MDSNTPQTDISYADALKRLRDIVDTLQSPSCNIDDMVTLTREAAALITICRRRLTTTQEELNQVLAQLNACPPPHTSPPIHYPLLLPFLPPVPIPQSSHLPTTPTTPPHPLPEIQKFLTFAPASRPCSSTDRIEVS